MTFDNHPSHLDSWRAQAGLWRSVVTYYWNPVKLRRMRRFYAQFVRPGGLCFDVGAHVGNRVLVWSRLGARVVAIEPQPACLALLRRWYGHSPTVTLVGEAVGAEPGVLPLFISPAHPTVSTLSRPWIDAVQQADSFAHVRWESGVPVPVTTLDGLIARYGEPAFCKIDIEGFELEALRGLTRPLPALSFEYVAAARAEAAGCIERLMELGDYRFNWSRGERHRWESARWLSGPEALALVGGFIPEDGSGDIYARLASGQSRPAV